MKSRKLVSVLTIISLLLLAMAATAVMVGAQEPEVTPTEEATEPPVLETTEVVTPTVEATEVATPTVEATEVVTPTVEATEVVTPTVEPTEEVTPEPTAEPTEEATSEPTEEPADQPTEQPTDRSTEQPTVEPTATPPPEELMEEAEGQGEVESQDVVGSWTSQYIGLQNLGSSTANMQFDLYAQGSTTRQGPAPFDIPVGENVTRSASDLGIGNGAYSGVVNSSEPVAAAVLNLNSTYKVGDIYTGFSSPSQRQTLPLIYRHHYNYTSKFHIQNAHSSAQDIIVDTYLIGDDTASASHTYTDVPEYTSFTVDFANDSNYDGFGSGNEHYGYAVVRGSSGNVAAICESIKDEDDVDLQTYYNGLSDDVAGQNLIAPLVYNNHVDWKSGVVVVNMEDDDTTVTMNYVSNKGSGSASVDIDPNSSGLFYMPWYTPEESYGTATFSSDTTEILAVVNTVKYRNGAVGSALPAMSPAVATTKIAVPLTLNEGGNGWKVGMNVYSLDGGPIYSTWVRADSDPAVAGNLYTEDTSATANGVALLYGPWIVPTGFEGAVYIESPGRILAVTNFVSYDAGINAGLPSYNYE